MTSLVKIHIRCIAIFFLSIFFETEKENQIFKYNPTEYNVISLVLKKIKKLNYNEMKL